jgi:hypothetical protein
MIPYTSSRNDKTIATVDPLIQTLKNGTIPLFATYAFNVFDSQGDAKCIHRVYALAWLPYLCGEVCLECCTQTSHITHPFLRSLLACKRESKVQDGRPAFPRHSSLYEDRDED